ncbi:FkbM family methyltransferase [Montanilutibacter psychrotolerans]|uniref:FkbM family methyltransferase n=1 Tax=Montanilutibacter psychrotolerans TaxID=1327343 RepID=A0A3M8SSQ9_9GAMM|nr:FkbM family methyltransferase [Lysobacter psychrotolerans]RNF84357.1 FkbM family methyltransferase [Lysobacter psychrotolerans]
MTQALNPEIATVPTAQASVFEHDGCTIHMLLPSAEDHISKGILSSKAFYESELLRAVGAKLSPGDWVLDVGANIGNHTVFFARVRGCNVVSFEPNPEAFHFLKENVRLNAVESLVRLHPLAVGSGPGRVSMVSSMANNLGATRFGVDENGEVEVVRLDDMPIGGRVALLKVDVEGMDLAVLRGAQATIEKHRPMIVCEAQTPEEFEEIHTLLAQHGYSVLGCFNATATYLFMPAKTAAEKRELPLHEADELLRTQMTLRATVSQVQKLKQAVDKQAFLGRQLSARLSGDGADVAATGGVFAELEKLASSLARIDDRLTTLAPRVDQAQNAIAEVAAKGMTGLSMVGEQAHQMGQLAVKVEQTSERLAHLTSDRQRIDAELAAGLAKVDGRVDALLPRIEQAQGDFAKQLAQQLAEFGEDAAGHTARLSTQLQDIEAALAAHQAHAAEIDEQLHGSFASAIGDTHAMVASEIDERLRESRLAVLGDTRAMLESEVDGIETRLDERFAEREATIAVALATQAGSAAQLRTLEATVDTVAAGLDDHTSTLARVNDTQREHDAQLAMLRAAIGEADLRIGHVLALRNRLEAEHGAQIGRLDQRISEQVRHAKSTAEETQASLARLNQLEENVRDLRGRHDALLGGRVFSFLRQTKGVVRTAAWPLLKLMGRVPATEVSVAPALTQTASPAALSAPVAPRVPTTQAHVSTTVGSAPAAAVVPSAAAPAVASREAARPAAATVQAPAKVAVPASAAAATPMPTPVQAPVVDEAPPSLVLTDIPYMRRPLATLKTDFVRLPVPANTLVSVIMTTFNTEQYVREAVESILTQTHANLELLVVDDCSTDRTREIVQEIAAVDPRVRLLCFGSNRGTYWCKNHGITQARGAAITFMDSDDVSEPERVAKQLALLSESGCAVSTCLHERRDPAGNLIAVNGRTKRLAYISQMMRRDVFDTVGYFDSVRTSADDEMLRRIKRVFGEDAHKCVHEVLYKALVRDESLTQDPANRGLSTVPGGLAAPRKAYSDAVDAWHADLAKRGRYPFVPFPVVRRPFAVHSKLGVVRGAANPDESISVCLASFPPRRSALRAAIDSLIDQVDRIFVYLNEYDEVPQFLKHPRITVKIGGEDLRDNGKFYFGPELPEGYCFTVDDDIVYPPDYVQRLIRKIELYGRKALVGVHGTIFAKPIVSYFADRTLFHFKHPLERDRIVNQLGTGTLAFHTSLWRPSHTAFASTGMVDAWIAVEAAKRGIPLIVVDRKRNWLKPMEEPSGAPPSLFEEYRQRDSAQTELVLTGAPWTEEPGSELARFLAERLAAGGDAFANGIVDLQTSSTSAPAIAKPAVAMPGKGGATLLHLGTDHEVRPRTRGCVCFEAGTDPERMKATVGALLVQFDELCVVLPAAQGVPEFLIGRPGVHVWINEVVDERARFDAIEGFKGYYIPLDAAIDYPPHYVRQLVDAIDRYDRKAVVGWHGTPAVDSAAGPDGGDRQVKALTAALCAFHTDTLKVSRADFTQDADVDAVLARLGRVQAVPFVELGDAPVGSKAALQSAYLTVRPAPSQIAPVAADASDLWRMPALQAPYRRPNFRLAVVGRTDRERWKKGGILKSTHLTADMLRPYGVDVALVDLETGDPRGLDGHPADIVMIYPGDPERPDFVNVLDLVDHHARQGRSVLVNLSLNGRSTRKKFICEQMAAWRAQYGKRVAMMVFSDRVFDDPELAPVLDGIVAIPKTLQIEAPRYVDFHSTSGIFLGDYGKLCDDSLLAWPAADAIEVIRNAVPHARLFTVQQYRPKVKKDLGVEILPFLTDDFSEVLATSRLMVSLVKFATFEMVPIEVASLGVPLLHAKMENSLSDYLGLGAMEVTSLRQLAAYCKLIYDDPLCWSGLSRAGMAIANGADYRNLSAQMYLRLQQFLHESNGGNGSPL